MKDDDNFITHLLSFGLSEKEAHCYFYLLKYGPRTPSPLAKAVHTYREDVHRTLHSLIDKGMVRPSLDSPTMYTAVELEAALESALSQHEAELREMERRKRELAELAQQQRFRPSDEVSTFKMVKTIREIISVMAPAILSVKEEYLWIAPREGLEGAAAFGLDEVAKEVIERDGHTRGITNITYPMIPLVRTVLATGEDIRHAEGYNGLYYGVYDRKHCISAINIDIKHLRLDEPAIMLYTDDPVYAKYLASTFELVWEQSIPAEQRIEELLKQGPAKIDEK
ncbi:MAG: TrmB family transcriptional regulator [Halobacteriota archaeon]